jgi:hypothetical protein
MNPKYLWLTGATELLTIFVVGPVLAIAIAYAAWRSKPKNFTPRHYGIMCVGSGMAAFLLLGFAKWMNADVRTARYFLQLASVLLGGLLLGVSMGCGFPVLLHLWRWHKATQLTDNNSAAR